MHGCHNCTKRPSPGEDYNKTACASCKLLTEKNSGVTNSYIFFDDNAFFSTWGAVYPEVYEKEITQCPYLERMFQAMASAMQILTALARKQPQTYRVVMAKIASPRASYSEIAKELGCRKQNIQYHLDRFLQKYPSLHFLVKIYSPVPDDPGDEEET